MGGTPEQLANDAIIRKEIDEFLKEKGVKSLWELEN